MMSRYYRLLSIVLLSLGVMLGGCVSSTEPGNNQNEASSNNDVGDEGGNTEGDSGTSDDSGTETDNNGSDEGSGDNDDSSNDDDPVPPQPLQEVTLATDTGLLVAGGDADHPGFTLYIFDNDPENGSSCNGGCAGTWPPLLLADDTASGVGQLGTITRDDGGTQVTYDGRPLYYYAGDANIGDTNGDGLGGVWHVVDLTSASVTPLYDESTVLEPAIVTETDDALITRIADRGRDRHAKENHFSNYDHYLTFYWEQRTAAIEIIDYVAKGGDNIVFNVRTEHFLDAKEARAFYLGTNTLAEYCDNGGLVQVGGEDSLNYTKEITMNCREGYRALQAGDLLEFEISQFLEEEGLENGRTNYYGTTYLYIVGEGLVPWDTYQTGTHQPGVQLVDGTRQRDSKKIPESAWLGGMTTLHAEESNEPDNHFLQMATNLGYENGQPFVLGRRLVHSSFLDGSHDESAENGVFDEVAGLAGTHYINDRCSNCHERNGGAAPAGVGELLDRWVFKIGDAEGNPDPARGRVLQPKSTGGTAEGNVSIAYWTETDGLRAPTFEFSSGTPATFSARIAPRLVGMGLIEAIPEASILAAEDPNDTNEDGISGRANRVVDATSGNTLLGRYGWKAAQPSLRHQISAALNTDMGVMTSLMPNPDCGSEQTDCGSAGVELTDDHLLDLEKYIALLGVRPQRNYDDEAVIAGEARFTDIGCAACHTPTFETSPYHPFAELRSQTIHPYSDFLLHDMGDGLADTLSEGDASGREWRTQPLWGLGLSACVTGGVTGDKGNPAFGDDTGEVCDPEHAYLHDGRARTLEEAILWHGGEGQASTNAYQALTDTEKANLLEFLKSL